MSALLESYAAGQWFRASDEGDPLLDDYLQPEDVANAVVTVLRQPRRMRTTLWAMWSMAQAS